MPNPYNFPVAYLNSNDGSALLAFGELDSLSIFNSNSLIVLSEFINRHKDSYIFGCLNYNLKNEIEKLTSKNNDHIGFPQVLFFVPKCVVKIDHESFEFVQGEKNKENFEFINYFIEEETDQNFHQLEFNWKPRTTKDKYIESVEALKNQIRLGNIYEVNYCQEFYDNDVSIDFPLDFYFKLNQITKAPFSVYFQYNEFNLFCGSPERFLKKTDQKLISQPIKGTAPRHFDPKIDEEYKEMLKNDLKERAENIMIVDLVRNDLSKVAEKDSVNVDELCEVYSFENVHQMISTISCTLKNDQSFTDIIRATFPMGSMTGAPKLRAMQIIDEIEDFSRGIYSGTVGYISPNGDFDFNVVIRSMVYNSSKKYLSCAVGSAITLDSDPEQEYQECQTKISRILKFS
jgi:para-aminobenzoate synthetase component 1